jgi:hypothetical protein
VEKEVKNLKIKGKDPNFFVMTAFGSLMKPMDLFSRMLNAKRKIYDYKMS